MRLHDLSLLQVNAKSYFPFLKFVHHIITVLVVWREKRWLNGNQMNHQLGAFSVAQVGVLLATEGMQ